MKWKSRFLLIPALLLSAILLNNFSAVSVKADEGESQYGQGMSELNSRQKEEMKELKENQKSAMKELKNRQKEEKKAFIAEWKDIGGKKRGSNGSDDSSSDGKKKDKKKDKKNGK
ncbi:MAG: hypothetical protein HON76_08545, partial [Candidatus Scalindua sp.]|nr:hypothetical protein [Candidatus Scalindua sp.]